MNIDYEEEKPLIKLMLTGRRKSFLRDFTAQTHSCGELYLIKWKMLEIRYGAMKGKVSILFHVIKFSELNSLLVMNFNGSLMTS